jgi:hypothetical protein
MQSPSEFGGPPESRREEGASNPPDARPENRHAQPWGLSFILFLLGFVLLVVLAKLKLSRMSADVLRGLAAVLCIAAFVIARRTPRPRR